jgi:two-component system sensor histidine kinase RegB
MSTTPVAMRHVVAWLQPVRWITCVAIWTALAVGALFTQLDLSLRAIGAIGLAAAICRTGVVLLSRGGRPLPGAMLGLALAADTVLLTGLLDVTGGPFNPFVVMYGVYIWLAAVAISRAWTFVVSVAALAAFGWLVVDHVQAGLIEHHRLNDFPTHLFTMGFAAAGVAELVAHYLARARALLAQRQRQLDEARERAARSERLASLTTLAAGAAHELSTPLATIAVAAREVERNAARVSDPPAAGAALRDDARLIRAELVRCQSILDGMSGRAGGGAVEAVEPLAPASITRLVVERLPETRRRRLSVEVAPDTPHPSATGAEMVQAISSLVKNAFDASGNADNVLLRFARRDGMVRVEVRDGGVGMSPEAVRRAGEPFYTTKEPGRGLGLGLFLVRTFAERAGGTLEFGSEFESQGGTTAILEVPALRPEASMELTPKASLT